jgi:hypothetical protein
MPRRTASPNEGSASLSWAPAALNIQAPAARSTNLERDRDRNDLSHLILTGRAHDYISRFTAALADPSRSRSWSLTGPYGTGKSSLALLLDALCGPAGEYRDNALAIVSARDAELATSLRARLSDGGHVRASVTARREPLAATIHRALTTGIKRLWPTRRPDTVTTALRHLEDDPHNSSRLLSLIEAICQRSPLLIVIDEFGKTLEHFSTHAFTDDEDDLYLLQEIAELGAGRDGLPVYLLTLQHASFLDYAMQASGLRRREWAKIQGRFEDVAFLPDIADAVQLIGNCVTFTRPDRLTTSALETFADNALQQWRDHGLDSILTGSADLMSRLYPLHPLTAVATPLLAATLGQHDRTLTSFLAADEPGSVARWLSQQNRQPTGATELALVRLPQLYDYFLGSGRTNALAAGSSHRWLEVETRISEAHGLTDRDQEILKTIGILNIVDAGGALRASAEVISFALDHRPLAGADGLKRRLQHLEKRGFITHRAFADEYRVWQGTDVDIQARVNDIAQHLPDENVVAMIGQRFAAGAIAAGKHSQTTGMLRHFTTAVTLGATDLPTVDAGGPADGTLIYHLGHRNDLPRTDSQLPVLIGVSDHRQQVLDAARSLAALEELLDDASLDVVARRETAERIGQARSELSTTMAIAYAPSTATAQWLLQMPGESTPTPINPTVRSLAALVSHVCDLAYPNSPHIRNEMLGRHQLTSQGAKARRNMLQALVVSSHLDSLGFGDGWGPERAMYHGVVEHLGLHGHSDAAEGAFQLSEPDESSSTHPVWNVLRAELQGATKQTPVADLFTTIASPPFGVKAGVVPVLITTALLLYSDDVAIFEEGSYVPRLTPEHVERLIAAPSRFTVKYVAVRGGQRHAVLENIARRRWPNLLDLPRRPGLRNPALVNVTNAILDDVRQLSPYALATRQVPEPAQRLREALQAAQEPDTLIFRQIPQALDLPVIGARATVDAHAAQAYASALHTALDALRASTAALRNEAIEILADVFQTPTNLTALRRDLVTRARPLENAIVPQELRGFVDHIGRDIDDEDWLNPLVLQLVGRGIDDFHDDTLRHFAAQARALARSFDRVTNLYFHATRHDGDAFDARQITLTAPDGFEDSLVVHVSAALEPKAKDLVEAVRVLALDTLGTGGDRILLAALARDLIDPNRQRQTSGTTSALTARKRPPRRKATG